MVNIERLSAALGLLPSNLLRHAEKLRL